LTLKQISPIFILELTSNYADYATYFLICEKSDKLEKSEIFNLSDLLDRRTYFLIIPTKKYFVLPFPKLDFCSLK
jgi:hypothetical protein